MDTDQKSTDPGISTGTDGAEETPATTTEASEPAEAPSSPGPAGTDAVSSEPTPAKPEPEPAETAPEPDLDSMDFGDVLARWEKGLKTVKEGAVVRGKVLKILDKEVIVDIGYKSEGVIDIEEFRDPGGGYKVAIGDEVDVLLEKTEDSDGYVVLSKEKAERLKVWEVVEKAYQTGEPVQGRVVDRIKGGLKVDIGLPAFLPGSLVDVRPVRNLESLRGEQFRMRVIKVNRRRGNIVLSRKAVLEEENAEKKKKTLEEMEEGKIFRGTVKNLTEYGAFVDLGGIDGLLHITDMSWGRINHPSEKFRIGDEMDVVVLKFDRERERVSLGFKQLQDDPWETAAVKYPPHTRVRGKVVSITDYGAFVELEEGIEGLIHVSEMSWTKRVKHPSKILSVGDWVECVVLEIDQDGRRLSLGLKQTEPNPWDMITSKYRVGDRITGTVRNITDFGAFVEVEEGIDGLVHISDLSWTRRIKHPSEVLNKGDEVEAAILKIDSENQRLSLGIKQLQPNSLEDFFRSHKVGDILRGKIVRMTEFGAFVELFEGVEGLVHISEMSKDRIERPEDLFSLGQEVRVKIIKMDPVERKIGLSIKAALDEPEDASLDDYREAQPAGGATLGDLLSAKVLRPSSAEATEGEPSSAEATEGGPSEDEGTETSSAAEATEDASSSAEAAEDESSPAEAAEDKPSPAGDTGAEAEKIPSAEAVEEAGSKDEAEDEKKEED